MRQLSILVFVVLLGFSLTAQERAKSPFSKTMQTVGLTDITVEYSRPGLKDRAAFGNDSKLAPLNKLWRTGANAVTTITFSDDVKVGGKDVSAGSYVILTMPGADSWKFHLYTPHEGYWVSFREDTPVLAVSATPTTASESQESFLISFDHLKDHSAHMNMAWGTTRVAIPIEVK